MTINQPPEATVEVLDDGTLRIIQPERTYRYLLSTGDVVDVVATRDDSDVRELVRAHVAGLAPKDQRDAVRIEGTVQVAGKPVPPVTRKAKR